MTEQEHTSFDLGGKRIEVYLFFWTSGDRFNDSDKNRRQQAVQEEVVVGRIV
jgi:hypothetical protein